MNIEELRKLAEKPDFEKLRAERDAEMLAVVEKFAQEHGVPASSIKLINHHHGCYCACSTGGPCEHKWDGDPYVDVDYGMWSTTCSLCGITSFSHDMSYME